MINELIRQLDDDDPARRKAAVIALGKSRNMAALRPLANVYRNDPEPEIRELARKAGVFIRQHAEVEAPPPPTPTPNYAQPKPEEESYTQRRMRQLEEARRAEQEAEKPPAEEQIEYDGRRPIRGREYRVPKDNRERAKKYVDAALDYNLKGDDARAMKNLTEAISLDPNLINDPYFNSVAGSVTTLDGDAAVDMIIDRGKRKDFQAAASSVTKKAKIDKHMEVATKSSWTDVIWEGVIYTLISIFGPVVAGLISMQMAMNSSAAAAESGQVEPLALSLQNALMTFTAATLIPIGFIAAFIFVGGLILQLILVHFLAVRLFNGHGTIQHLLSTLLGFYNRWLPVLFLVEYLSTAIFFVSGGSPISACFVIVFVVLSIYILFGTSGRIAKAYDFGTLNGCLAYNISNLVVVAVIGVVMFLLLQVLGTAVLESMFQLNPTLIPPVQ